MWILMPLFSKKFARKLITLNYPAFLWEHGYVDEELIRPILGADPEARLGSPRPHLHRDWAHPGHIYTDRDWAHPGHICTGTQPRARPLGKPVPYLAPGLKAEG
jgi:hypothetical protein